MLMVQCPCCHVVFDQEQATSYKINTRKPKAREWPPIHQDQEVTDTTAIDNYPELNN